MCERISNFFIDQVSQHVYYALKGQQKDCTVNMYNAQ